MADQIMSLRQAKNIDEVCSLERDNLDLGNWSVLCDGRTVYISEYEKTGRIGGAQIPKNIFDQIVDFYCKSQKVLKRD